MTNDTNTNQPWTPVESRLVAITEAAEALALDPLTIRLAIAQKRLRVVYIGKSIRVPVAALDEYVEGLVK